MNMLAGQYLTFKLDDMAYGVPISTIREINRMSVISPVPESPSYVSGVMNLRGKVIPVVDLRLRLAMPKVETTKETCIIVVEADMGQIGVIVDSVQAVMDLAQTQIDASPIAEENPDNFIGGIGKLTDQLILLIDIQRCLARDHWQGLKAA